MIIIFLTIIIVVITISILLLTNKKDKKNDSTKTEQTTSNNLQYQVQQCNQFDNLSNFEESGYNCKDIASSKHTELKEKLAQQKVNECNQFDNLTDFEESDNNCKDIASSKHTELKEKLEKCKNYSSYKEVQNDSDCNNYLNEKEKECTDKTKIFYFKNENENKGCNFGFDFSKNCKDEKNEIDCAKKGLCKIDPVTKNTYCKKLNNTEINLLINNLEADKDKTYTENDVEYWNKKYLTDNKKEVCLNNFDKLASFRNFDCDSIDGHEIRSRFDSLTQNYINNNLPNIKINKITYLGEINLEGDDYYNFEFNLNNLNNTDISDSKLQNFTNFIVLYDNTQSITKSGLFKIKDNGEWKSNSDSNGIINIDLFNSTKNIKIALKKSKFELSEIQKEIDDKYSNRLSKSKIVKIYLQIPNINSDAIDIDNIDFNSYYKEINLDFYKSIAKINEVSNIDYNNLNEGKIINIFGKGTNGNTCNKDLDCDEEHFCNIGVSKCRGRKNTSSYYNSCYPEYHRSCKDNTICVDYNCVEKISCENDSDCNDNNKYCHSTEKACLNKIENNNPYCDQLSQTSCKDSENYYCGYGLNTLNDVLTYCLSKKNMENHSCLNLVVEKDMINFGDNFIAGPKFQKPCTDSAGTCIYYKPQDNYFCIK